LESTYQGTASPEQLDAMKKAQIGIKPDRTTITMPAPVRSPRREEPFLLWARCG